MPWFYDCMDSTGLHERTARKGSLHARAALPSTYSAEAIGRSVFELSLSGPPPPARVWGPSYYCSILYVSFRIVYSVRILCILCVSCASLCIRTRIHE